MSSNDHKLTSLAERRQEVQRELAELAAAKDSSANTALGELEYALLAELDKIDQQINQIRSYLSNVHDAPEAAA